MAASNSFLSTPLLKPSVSHFAKPLVSIPIFCLYKNMKKKNMHAKASAVAADSSETAILQNDSIETKTTNLNEKTEKLVLPTNDSSGKLLRIRHTCAHVMAMAVQKLYPDAKVTIGPWIDNGFYYDFDIEPLTDKDLKRIKKEMDRIIARNLPLIREEVSRDEAQRRIMAINEPYKMEILESIKEDPITIYHIALGFSEPFLYGSISLPLLYFSPPSYVAPFVIDTKGFGKYLLDFVVSKGEIIVEMNMGRERWGKKIRGSRCNEWWDLCAGPHVETTGNIDRKAVELESVAGAYWRGDEKKPMLQRIYGTAWEDEEQLKAYLHFKEEAKRRDHRRLGQDLDLFSIQEEAGGGLVFWHPKGAIVRNIIEDSWKKIHIERGYDLLYTPHVARADLWKISGHLDFYRENMYDQMNIEEELYQLRPMNCPYHILVYKRKLNSYRDFPIRVAELGTVYRYELSGSLHGLFRVRGFTQDDAHIFCLEDQIKDEIRGVLDLTEEMLLQFGFHKYEVNLSTRPEKAVGGDDIWEKATSALRDALDDKGWSYELDEGGGAFYGPKIDLKIEDALGRKWQCSTIQAISKLKIVEYAHRLELLGCLYHLSPFAHPKLPVVDFNLPQRFDMTYVDSNSEKKRPIMIHRAVLGSLERFFGVLIEHYVGDFPLWLSPIQARVLPVTDIQLEYCNEVRNKLKANSIRAEVCHGERLPKLIRNAEKQKIPLMAVVGPKEVEMQTVTVRSRFGGELGTMMLDDFISRIKSATENRTSF
ncbi:Threonine--tRNA ligase [Morella rubra]|uniref:threonine--tRNA ligase n=1 Tax=Morella rubra TaxID=262757 RepID=A0A6A1V7P2_9ROSI|nr:Threonine--tRNA ligase [Morella rubra]